MLWILPPFCHPRRCVTPYLLVPGPWTDSDLEYVADGVAGGLTNNAGKAAGGAALRQQHCGWLEASQQCLLGSAGRVTSCCTHPAYLSPCLPASLPPATTATAGHNCLKAELIVTDRGWPLREKFLAALRRKLAALPNRVAYYPGSDAKHAAFLGRFPDAEPLGGGSAQADGAALDSGSGRAEVAVTPWLLKAGLSPEQAATQDENWCGVLQASAEQAAGRQAGAIGRRGVRPGLPAGWPAPAVACAPRRTAA